MLKHILLQESRCSENVPTSEHLRLIETRKKQALRDYILVCIQRLKRPERIVNDNSHDLHQVVYHTLHRWML